MSDALRIGFGYDSHRLEEGNRLILGGVEIPFDKGCIAHSDGDVVIHALCDALLGSLALKDIGSHFPDKDPQYKNIDSKILLQHVVQLIHDRSWQINNVDITIIIEKPKIAPHIDRMIDTLSPILSIEKSTLSIKAKTNEKMGFVGEGNGIVAVAVVTIKSNH